MTQTAKKPMNGESNLDIATYEPPSVGINVPICVVAKQVIMAINPAIA